jgi:very-short-patch-repair endonuclease
VRFEQDFEQELERFIQSHCKRRQGERLRRLRDGLGHAEKTFLNSVWWPTFQTFDHLHPEYEVFDYKDGYRYIDFAYIQPYVRLAIEIDGFGPHWRNISRWQFADYCRRQNDLLIDGWNVLRFSYDDVSEHPRLCQQAIQQLMGRWLGIGEVERTTNATERDVIRLALRSLQPITPRDVCELLRISPAYARKTLHGLTERQWLKPATGSNRVRSYKLHPSRRNIKL